LKSSATTPPTISYKPTSNTLTSWVYHRRLVNQCSSSSKSYTRWVLAFILWEVGKVKHSSFNAN